MKKLIILVMAVIFALPVMAADLSEYPELFVKNGTFEGYIVVGDQAPAQNIIAAIDITSSFDLEVQPTRLASEMSDLTDVNLISVGNACNNAITAQLLDNPEFCKEGLVPGHGIIELIYDGRYYLIVAGYSVEDTRKAARVLSNYQSYELTGNCMLVGGSFAQPKVTPCGELEIIEQAVPAGILPDLVITTVAHEGIINTESEFDVPYIRFAITVKNIGEAPALLAPDVLGVTGIWGRLNGKDLGWVQTSGEEYLEPDESRTFYWDYADDHAQQILQNDNNIIFYVDRVFLDMSLYPDGKVREANEENNEFDYAFWLETCVDTEDGTTLEEEGVVALYGVTISDSVDDQGIGKEYWCAGDYSVGYGYGYLDYENLPEIPAYKIEDELTSGETKMYELLGNDYEISATIEGERVQFTVNGEVTPWLVTMEEKPQGDYITVLADESKIAALVIDAELVKFAFKSKGILEVPPTYEAPPRIVQELEEVRIVQELAEARIVQVKQPEECEGIGCPADHSCLMYGLRMLQDSNPVYCDISSSFAQQKKDDEMCQNNYECLSNSCGNGVCQDFGERLEALEKEMKETRGILDTILDWLKGWFSED